MPFSSYVTPGFKNTSHVVFGPPGTGKTTYLARGVRAAAEEYGPDRVVCASLTRTAAAEIAGRDLPVPEEQVGTLHAICYRALDCPKLVYDTVADFNEAYGRKLTTSDVADEDRAASPDDALMQQISRLRAARVPRERWSPAVRNLAEQWDNWKSATETLDFTDLIERGIRELRTAPFGAKAVFYDEAQDGSALELQLVRQWADSAEQTVICGDDDQALYTWRGASVEAFLGFSEDHLVLDRSYRLPAAIWQVAERQVTRIAGRKEKVYGPAGHAGEVVRSQWGYRNAEYVVRQYVQPALEAGQTVMMIGFTLWQTRPWQMALKERGVPFHNPYRRDNPWWNPLRLSSGRMNSARRVLAAVSLPWTWAGLWAATEKLGKRALQHGAVKRLEEMKASTEVIPYEVLDELLREEVRDVLVRADLKTWASMHESKLNKSMQYPIRVYDRYGLEGLQSRPKVVVGTIHSVKGGEADVVIVAPDYSRAWWAADTTVESRSAIARVAYVGMTRAKQKLIMLSGESERAVIWR